jgi:hypothetical protein
MKSYALGYKDVDICYVEISRFSFSGKYYLGLLYSPELMFLFRLFEMYCFYLIL